MKTRANIAWILAFILLGLAGYRIVHDTRITQGDSITDLSQSVYALEEQAHKIFSESLVKPVPSSVTARLRKEKWYWLSYEDGHITAWNSNKVDLDTQLIRNGSFPALYQFGDDTYCVFQKESNYLLFRLANDGKLHPRVVALHPELSHRNIVPLNRMVVDDFAVQTTAQLPTRFSWLLLFFFACIVLFLLLLHDLNRQAKYFWLTPLVLVGIEGLVFNRVGVDASTFFLTTESSFTVFPPGESLALLFIHVIVGLSILLSVFLKLAGSRKWFLDLLIATILLFAVDLLVDLSILLSKASPISFDFQRVFGLTFHTFSSIAFIGLSAAAVWLLVYTSRIFRTDESPRRYLYFVLAAVLFCTFQIIDASRSIPSLFVPIAVTLLSALILRLARSKQQAIYLHFVLTAVLTSLIVFIGQQHRESRYIQQFASDLMENRDENAERILRQIENQLAQEFLVPEDFDNFMQRKDAIENRLLQLYFSNYLKKYDLKLFSFDSTGNNVNQNSLFPFAYLDQQYNHNTTRTLSDYFYSIDQPDKFYGYIAKYENCDINGHNGTTFILLQPRVVESDFLYPEVFANQQSKQVVALSEYSYALYFNRRLINQKGSYSYPLTYAKDLLITNRSFQHRSFSNSSYTTILTSPSKGILDWLPSLTFTLALLLPFSFLFSLLMRWVLHPTHPLATAFLPGTSKYLSSRIQTSLTIILLAGLLLSVYIIIGFIRNNYNENLENQLLQQVKNIGNRIQDRVDLEKKLSDPEERTLILNEESNTHKVDINLYRPNGELLGSTKPYLTKNQILAPRMNPKAFAQLIGEEHSFLLIQEELEGSDYLSAYVPLFDEKNQVIAYLNTPYFARNEVLNKQISSLIVNVLNIYFLLLLAGIFIAYIISKQISKPLILIREKIAKTELLGQNELIVYERDDEIGQLVKQYNKMVLELEESANQLAESEREGAWREMAKQVAHEIKNPLTPMKLSIQHLQRAFTDGPSEKLEALFQKTSRLLVEQIDSLSDMASEFSNFAKMPEDNYTDFDLSTSVSKVVDLFLQSENVKIIREIEPNIWIHADEQQIQRVFNNLIKNAIQAIPENVSGNIKIKLQQDKNGIRASVSDNGSGIPTSLQKKVFVPNFSTKNSGMGLGLAICKKIVETAGGSIHFTSKPNKGTTFELNLPAIEKP